MGPEEFGFLAAVAFAAGAINAVAGGGSLLSFPALIAVGVPVKTANVTNNVALWPGYLSGTIAYRRELDGQRKRALALLLPSAVGAVGGSAILLLTPTEAFEAIVPFLILFACALMAFQRPISNFTQARRMNARYPEHVPASLYISSFLMAIYGAYFGAGLGIMLLSVLSVLLPDDLHRCNALKGFLSFAIGSVAAVYFGLFGPVLWPQVFVMGAAAIAGGYLGVAVVRRVPAAWLRTGVVAYGVVVATVLFVQ